MATTVCCPESLRRAAASSRTRPASASVLLSSRVRDSPTSSRSASSRDRSGPSYASGTRAGRLADRGSTTGLRAAAVSVTRRAISPSSQAPSDSGRADRVVVPARACAGDALHARVPVAVGGGFLLASPGLRGFALGPLAVAVLFLDPPRPPRRASSERPRPRRPFSAGAAVGRLGRPRRARLRCSAWSWSVTAVTAVTSPSAVRTARR